MAHVTATDKTKCIATMGITLPCVIAVTIMIIIIATINTIAMMNMTTKNATNAAITLVMNTHDSMDTTAIRS